MGIDAIARSGRHAPVIGALLLAAGTALASGRGPAAADRGDAPIPWIVRESPDGRALQGLDCRDGSVRGTLSGLARAHRLLGIVPRATGSARCGSIGDGPRRPDAAGAPAGTAPPDGAGSNPSQALAVLVDREGRVHVVSLPALAPLGPGWHAPDVASLALAADGTMIAGLDATGAAFVPRTLPDLEPLGDPMPTERPLSRLIDVPRRQSFVAIDNADRPPGLVEFARRCDAPPVFGGLVHDYRMGEAIALPGRFTPRRVPLPTTTQRVWPGESPYEILRLDTDGHLSVVHLEVRRELYRFAPAGVSGQASCARAGCAGGAAPIAVPWRRGDRHGWIVGTPGARHALVLAAGEPPRTAFLALPGTLLDLAPGEPLALVRAEGDGLQVLSIDVAAPAAHPRLRLRESVGVVRLASSVDGACVAVVDEAGWRARVPPTGAGSARAVLPTHVDVDPSCTAEAGEALAIRSPARRAEPSREVLESPCPDKSRQAR